MSGPVSIDLPKRVRRRRQEFALPMINVIFLLILYFLIVGTMVAKNELSFAPPVTLDVPDQRLPRPLLVLAPDGAMRLDGALLAPSAWLTAVQAVARPDDGFLNMLVPADYPASQLLARITALGRIAVPVRLVTIRPGREAAP